MRSVQIGDREIGIDRPCYVIAEAGSNHDGRLEQAFQLIDVAAKAGADAVKFQLFRAELLYPRSAGVSGYLNDPTPIFDIIAERELPLDWVPRLAERCRQCGVEFLASVFDEASADVIEKLRAVAAQHEIELVGPPLQ